MEMPDADDYGCLLISKTAGGHVPLGSDCTR
jgi:hypothetical protein